MLSKMSSDFQLPVFVAESGLVKLPAGELPIMRWPSGRWCVEANMYLQSLVYAGLSTLEGGTVKTYSRQLVHFVRYCSNKKIEFEAVSDVDFSQFILELTNETSPTGHKSRSATTVLQIGQTVLNFLEFVSDLHSDPHLLGPAGSVRATKVTSKSRSRAKFGTTWKHPALPRPSKVKTRFPIKSDTVHHLREAAAQLSDNKFLAMRRLAMITLLENTGGRRYEIGTIRTHSIRSALRDSRFMLKLASVKKGSGKVLEREVPIAKSHLDFVNTYIEINRAEVIRKTLGARNDHGFLFVNIRTGQPLSPRYLSVELDRLMARAGIQQPVSCHLFRHLFITRLFVRLYRANDFQSSDRFRYAILNEEALKKQAMEWSGHKSVSAFDGYVHLARNEVGCVWETFNAVLEEIANE